MSVKKVRQYISTILGDRNNIPVVGISGGVDSLVLADICCQLAFAQKREIVLYHFNHGMGAHDDICRDGAVNFANTVSKRWGDYIICIFENAGLNNGFDEVKEMKTNPRGFEHAARKIRYRRLHDIAKNYKSVNVLVGHHLNDHVETVLLGMGRGLPVNSLGMAYRTDFQNTDTDKTVMSIHRPLLHLTRNEILDYAKRRLLDDDGNPVWREDTSNSDLRYERNFIRHAIIPLWSTKRNIVTGVIKTFPVLDNLVISHKGHLFDYADE